MPSWADGSGARSSGGGEDRSPARPGSTPAPLKGPPALPPNQELFRLDEACRLTGLQPATIRLWAREVPAVAPAPASTGQLFLTRRQVLMLAEARLLADTAGLTPAEALQKVQTAPRTVAEPAEAPPAPAPRSSGTTSGPNRPPWEDTHVRNLVNERLEPILAGLEAPGGPRAGKDPA